ncbi:b(0,+)-type amino acid transporter 1-like [Polypterus senegalus]|uniref:b(0,+)-type amino acid transporter 1-like n=1 Tax=Polypterus senegalus TaxID=55291 RepID=UPI001964BACF|nr:b(0,+)-type amino acid transporter 1-like [Polypterus senegalus]
MANKRQLFGKVKATGAGAHVILQKSIGYFSGLNLLLGIIVGSGIFISPAGVLGYCRLNVGVALSIWAASGVMSMLGALCYTELGTALPSSGGDYYYVKRGLGSFPAFLLLLVDIIFSMPVGISIKSMTFAEYATKPFYTDCPTPEMVKKAIAIAVVIILTALNGVTIKGALWVQKIFTILKMQCLVLIAIGGLVEMAKGNTKNLENAFDGEVPTVSQICLAFYQGLWAYGGWNGLNKAEGKLRFIFKCGPVCSLYIDYGDENI